jgi:fucose permease
MDVGMNAHGVHVEEELGRPIMSSLHAGWAFGGMIGAAFAGVLAAIGAGPHVTVLCASVLLAALAAAAVSRIGRGSVAEGEETPGFVMPTRAVMLLAVLCLLVMVTEGAMGDWGGIYLRQNLAAAPALAAGAYAFFTAGMTLGRVFGDRVNSAIGPVRLLRLGAVLTAVPLATTLLLGLPGAALVGLFLVGLGVANGVPLMFSAAGRQPGVPSGVGIAAVSSMGSLGFLAGPPLIGFVAQAASLPWALSLLVLGALAVFALARRATGAPRHTMADLATSPRPSPTVQNSR